MSTPPQLPLDLDFRPSMSGEDFLVAPCNHEAVAWLDRYPEWNAPFLVIYGEAGCGKSHLAEVFRQATNARTVDLSLDPYQAMDGALAGILEDVDQWALKDQKALFHLYNYAKENGVHILMSARTPPSNWPLDLPDLKSRMGAVPVVEITQPDDQLMEMVLVKLFNDRQLGVEREVVVYMLSRMERSFDQARRLVKEIDAQALAQKRKITVPLVRDVLQMDSRSSRE